MQMHCLSFILTLTQCPRFYAKKAKEKLHQGEEKHKQYNQTTIISSSCTYNRKHHKFVTKCLAIRNNEEFIRVTTSGCLLSVRPSVCLLLLHSADSGSFFRFPQINLTWFLKQQVTPLSSALNTLK